MITYYIKTVGIGKYEQQKIDNGVEKMYLYSYFGKNRTNAFFCHNIVFVF